MIGTFHYNVSSFLWFVISLLADFVYNFKCCPCVSGSFCLLSPLTSGHQLSLSPAVLLASLSFSQGQIGNITQPKSLIMLKVRKEVFAELPTTLKKWMCVTHTCHDVPTLSKSLLSDNWTPSTFTHTVLFHLHKKVILLF